MAWASLQYGSWVPRMCTLRGSMVEAIAVTESPTISKGGEIDPIS